MIDGTFVMVAKSVSWCLIMLYRFSHTQVLYTEGNIYLKVQSVVKTPFIFTSPIAKTGLHI